jgi:hypothetical protein
MPFCPVLKLGGLHADTSEQNINPFVFRELLSAVKKLLHIHVWKLDWS